MKKLFLILAAACLTFSAADAQRLVILHTNDTHSQIEPLRTGRNEGLGGVDRRLQFIDSVRAHYGKKKVLLLDAGDYNQGTPYFTVAKGDLEQEPSPSATTSSTTASRSWPAGFPLRPARC